MRTLKEVFRTKPLIDTFKGSRVYKFVLEKSRTPLTRKYLFLLPAIVVALFIIYKVDSNAYIYAFFVLLSYCAVIIYLEKREKWKLAFIYIGSILFSLFVAELYYSFQYDEFTREFDLIYGEDLIRRDSVLGIVAMENSQYLSRAKLNGELIYEVKITVDEFGQRIMPKSPHSDQAVLFFGCSFTYGDGVEDHETLPYQFQEATQGNYNAYNFGFSGNGAHHNLAILENELEKSKTAGHSKAIGIYSVITDHIMRGTYSEGKTPSPRYRFDENGRLYRAGKFSTFKHKASYYLGKSNITKALTSSTRAKQKDLDLMLAMTERSAEIFETRYDGKFYCLLWRLFPEEHDGYYEKLLKGLNDRGIEVIEVEAIIPGYADNPYKYIIPNDLHPKALANKMIAEYLVDFLSN